MSQFIRWLRHLNFVADQTTALIFFNFLKCLLALNQIKHIILLRHVLMAKTLMKNKYEPYLYVFIYVDVSASFHVPKTKIWVSSNGAIFRDFNVSVCYLLSLLMGWSRRCKKCALWHRLQSTLSFSPSLGYPLCGLASYYYVNLQLHRLQMRLFSQPFQWDEMLLEPAWTQSAVCPQLTRGSCLSVRTWSTTISVYRLLLPF